MRILQVCSARTIGGGEKHLADLANSLARRGHEVYAALAPASPVKEELNNIPLERIKFSRMRNAFDVFSAFELAGFIRQNQIEIVHAHVARDYTLAALACELTGTPFVLTRHALFPIKSFQRFALRRVGGIIAVSQAVADVLNQQKLFPAEKIKTIYNGIDTKLFSPSEKFSNQTFTVGTIGHFAQIKGLDIFIRAAKIVLNQQPKIKFMIVGEDKSPKKENRQSLEKLIADLSLQENVELVGWTEDVRPLFYEFDLFVSSARSEPFGLVIAEAMASGIPVIATKTEGAQEIIEHEKSGLLVPLEDAENLAAAILHLFENQKERERFIQNARQRVCRHFSLERMVAETENFYFQILNNSR